MERSPISLSPVGKETEPLLKGMDKQAPDAQKRAAASIGPFGVSLCLMMYIVSKFSADLRVARIVVRSSMEEA